MDTHETIDDKFSIFFLLIGYGRTGSDPAVHSTSSMKTYNLKWYQRDQQRRHSTKNREAKGTPPSHCSTEQLIQNGSKVNNKNTHDILLLLWSLIQSSLKWNLLYYCCENSSCHRCFFYICSDITSSFLQIQNVINYLSQKPQLAFYDSIFHNGFLLYHSNSCICY